MPQLRITGPVSVEPYVTITENPGFSRNILIMGPTSSGKSSFIEAVAGEHQNLRISKDQLAGFTQEVNGYKLMNATMEWDADDGYPVYLIDTPGFSDSSISEMEIVDKVKNWMSKRNVTAIMAILYLCPITDTRVPGSKRQTIKMLRSLLHQDSSVRVTIVTTMWDKLYNRQAVERAEAHFKQLRDEVWRDLVAEGAQIVKFEPDQQSALDIIGNAPNNLKDFPPIDEAKIKSSDPAAPLLYRELLERIQNCRQEIQMLRDDQIQLITRPDDELESFVVGKLQEVKQRLSKFIGQLVGFGQPPPGFEDLPRQVTYQNLLDHVVDAREYHKALQYGITQLKQLPQSDPSHEFAVHSQLTQTEENLRQFAAELIKFGPPPKGFDLMILPSHILTPKNRMKQTLHQGKYLLNKFVKH